MTENVEDIHTPVFFGVVLASSYFIIALFKVVCQVMKMGANGPHFGFKFRTLVECRTHRGPSQTATQNQTVLVGFL
jgi:hypothetical protein